jgi:hypothetical protein
MLELWGLTRPFGEVVALDDLSFSAGRSTRSARRTGGRTNLGEVLRPGVLREAAVPALSTPGGRQ